MNNDILITNTRTYCIAAGNFCCIKLSQIHSKKFIFGTHTHTGAGCVLLVCLYCHFMYTEREREGVSVRKGYGLYWYTHTHTHTHSRLMVLTYGSHWTVNSEMMDRFTVSVHVLLLSL